MSSCCSHCFRGSRGWSSLKTNHPLLKQPPSTTPRCVKTGHLAIFQENFRLAMSQTGLSPEFRATRLSHRKKGPYLEGFFSSVFDQKILAPIKIESALPPPPKPKIPPPPKNEEFYGHGGFAAERTQFFQVPIKLAQPFPAPGQSILRTRGFWFLCLRPKGAPRKSVPNPGYQ